MRSKRKSRAVWKHILTTAVIALSVVPACEAEQRGLLLQAILETYDTDGDGYRRKGSPDLASEAGGTSLCPEAGLTNDRTN